MAASPPFFRRWYSRIVKANTGYVEKKNNDGQSLPQWGRLRYEDAAFLASSERIHACVEKQYPRQSLPRVGKVASGASRIGFWRYEKERERSSQVRRLREHPSTAVRSSFPKGEVKEEGASPPQKEANPALLRSAVPSRGRGSRGHSLLPMEEGAPKGRRLDGGKRDEKERGRSSQADNLRKHPIHR